MLSQQRKRVLLSLRGRKYTGDHTTRSGYWKVNGKDRTIIADDKAATVVGMCKMLVFYRERVQNGRKMEMVMHEFQAGKCFIDKLC
jgi:hypothetical protein